MPQQPAAYYVMTLACGEHWDASVPMRQQRYWDEHARLMDAFVDDGFIVLGGPLGSEEKILLVLNAASREAIEARFADDPWMIHGVRRIASIERWQILLKANS
ncbi:MAG TPA: hypothetical protein VFU69_13060 [Ktedonobacterales bacterium]|nr:hypothetical protein [Ktedonobacterales bacterium]